MEKSEERIQWIDIAKGIGIILVIIGHVSVNQNINNFIYSFHMPLFFIISGFLYKPKKDFEKHKAKSILIPYFSFSIISFIYWITIERFFREQEVSPLNVFINIFIARGDNESYIFNVVLWFLPCLFMTEIIFNFLINKTKSKYLKYIMFISSIIGFIFPKISDIRLPFCLDIVFTAIAFYYLGFLFKENIKNKFLIFLQKGVIYCILLIGIILIVSLLSTIEQGANMMNLKYKYYLIFYVTAILGFYMVYMISNKITINFLKWIGKNSLYIMCIHEPLKRIVIAIYSKIIGQNSELIRGNCLHIIIISVLVLLFTSILITIIFYLKDKLIKSKRILTKQI